MFKQPTRLSKTAVILSTLTLIALPIIGCSVEKKLNNMEDSTGHMDTTTQHMDTTISTLTSQMTQMKDDIDAMKKTEHYLAEDNDALKSSMAEMSDEGRQGQSMDDRRKLMFDTMKSVHNMGTKVGFAVLYFMSFEYQLWTDGGVPGDTLARRQTLVDEAVNEFFTTILEFWQDTPTVNPTGRKNLTEIDEQAENFNALAAALEWLNRKQREVVQAHTDVKPISMLSVIEEAIADQPKVDHGQKPPPPFGSAEQKIQANRAVALKLLNARQAVLPLLVLAKISPLGMEGSASSALRLMVPWSLNINNKSAGALTEGSYFLDQAQKTRQFLVGLGDPGAMPQTETSLRIMWANARVQFDKNAAVQSNGSTIATLDEQFAGLVTKEKNFHETEAPNAPAKPQPDVLQPARQPANPPQPTGA